MEPLALTRSLDCVRRCLAAVALAVVAPTAAAYAVTPYLVQDLGERIVEETTEYVAPFHAELDGVAYFYLNDGLHGRELWRSDGTTLGTYLVRDVCAGLCGIETFGTIDTLETAGSLVYFSGNDGVHGAELWATDGTSSGTRMVADIQAGPRSSHPTLFRSAGGILYFTADDGARGHELWRSDGTAAGTYLVAELRPGPEPGLITILEPGVSSVFLAVGGDQGGLWRSDGTATGTSPVRQDLRILNSGWYKGAPFRTLPNGVLVFSACSLQSDDCEPWRSDGTPGGTFRLADLRPGSFGSDPSGFARIGGEIWFTADGASPEQLFRTDGTIAGTAPLPLPPDVQATTHLGAAEVVGNRLYFVGYDSDHGNELWVTDGVSTQLVADLAPGTPSSMEPDFFQMPWMAELEGDLVFLADDGGGLGLWRTDGTAPGTALLTDFGSPPKGTWHFAYVQTRVPAIRASGRVLLEVHGEDVGVELWSSDGHAATTAVLLAVAHERSAFRESTRNLYSYVVSLCLTALRQGIVVAAADGSDPEDSSLYFLDGVPGGATFLGADFGVAFYFVPDCAANGAEVLAFGGSEGSTGLYRTHGVAADAELLLPFSTGPGLGSFPPFGRLGSRLAFVLGGDLYLAPEGADLVDFTVLSTNFAGGSLVEAQGLLFLGGGFSGIAVTDGKLMTTLIPPPSPPSALEIDDLTPSGAVVYFSRRTVADGAELWVSDGTVDGTRLVQELGPGPASAFSPREPWEQWGRAAEPRIAGLGDGRAVFAADDGVHGNELWITDGTEAGTALLTDVVPGPDGSWPRRLTSFGSTVVFAAEDPKHGLELWRTDGTPAGTALVRDLVVGPDSSVPEDLAVQAGLLYFSAWTPAHGREAWRSDGTPAGTYRITDLVPGARSSNPNRFLRAGELLFFVANDEIHGREVWALAPDGSFPLFLDGFESGATDRWLAAVP